MNNAYDDREDEAASPIQALTQTTLIPFLTAPRIDFYSGKLSIQHCHTMNTVRVANDISKRVLLLLCNEGNSPDQLKTCSPKIFHVHQHWFGYFMQKIIKKCSREVCNAESCSLFGITCLGRS